MKDETQEMRDAVCERCGAGIWDSASEKDRKDAEDFARWSLRHFGRVVLVARVCARCGAQEAIKAARAAVAARFRAAADAGFVAPNLPMYLRPPAGLVEKNKDVWDWASAWRPRGGCVFFHGPEGTGKSSVCKMMLARVLEAGGTAMSVQAAEIEAAWWYGDNERRMRRAYGARVLLLDDIGAPWTPRGLSILRMILDVRHERRLDTLITGNLDIAALHTRLAAVAGDEVYATSLLRRLRPLKIIHMTGESFRLQMEYGKLNQQPKRRT